ncbi:hypothetical protein CEXT_268641 [Caerostris extrusa]|uniref:Uncharacterized protein n=1 Tax=Caerostris extrusa TaxID=172846 RepID=A0AAV4NIX5_CAEEX|nr:hypothetical protein CEXT_268641 [Caerostris extrusa]
MTNVQQLQISRNLIKILKQNKLVWKKIPQSKIVCDVKKTDELTQNKLTAQNDKCPTATAIKKSDKNTEAKEASLEKSSQSKIVCDTKKTDELTPNKITVQNDKLPLVTDIKKSEKNVETKQTLEKKPENTFQTKQYVKLKNMINHYKIK